MDEVAAKTSAGLYDVDFYTWTQRQAELLRTGRLADADLPNIVEEIEALGRAEYNALRSSYRLVTLHLLKMKYQASHRAQSWTATIVRERNNIEDSLRDNPGLRPKRTEIFFQA